MRFSGCLGSMVIVLLIGLAVGVITARTIGLSQPNPAAAILKSDNCDIPCWRGIRPGITSIDEANMIAHQNAELTAFTDTTGSPDTHVRQVCWAIKHWRDWQGCAIRATSTQGPVDRINLVPSPALHFRLGEAIVVYGKPIGGLVCRGSRYIQLNVFFADNVELYAFGDINDPRIEPDMLVSLITYHYLGDEPPYPFDLPAWQGFRQIASALYC